MSSGSDRSRWEPRRLGDLGSGDIEIEVGDSSEQRTPSPTPPMPPGAVPGRRQYLVTLTLVALAAATVGWVVGRGTGRTMEPDVGSVEEAVTTEPPPTAPLLTLPPVSATAEQPTDDDIVGDSGPAVEPDEPTTDATVTTGLDMLPSATGLRLVGMSTGGDAIVDVDIDAGTIARQPIVTATASGNLFRSDGIDSVVVPVGDRYILYDLGVGGAYTVERGGHAQFAPDVFALFLPAAIQSSDPDAVWVVVFDDSTRIALVDADGNERPIPDLDVDPGFAQIVPDGTGAVLFRAPGGTYRTDATSVTRVTTGHVVATGQGHVVARECDEQLTCADVLVETTTGASRQLELPDELSTWLHHPRR